jgi:hypothetical protein
MTLKSTLKVRHCRSVLVLVQTLTYDIKIKLYAFCRFEKGQMAQSNLH